MVLSTAQPRDLRAQLVHSSLALCNAILRAREPTASGARATLLQCILHAAQPRNLRAQLLHRALAFGDAILRARKLRRELGEALLPRVG